MKLVLVNNPKRGQIACAKTNYERGLYLFFKFSIEDEEIAKKHNEKYYVIIEDNPVPSLDMDFTTDNSPLYVKVRADWRKNKKWELVTDLKWMPDGRYWICKTNRFGWTKLQHCKIKQNGVTTDKEQPKCSVCGTYTTRKKQNTDIYVCIDCSH